VSTIIPPKQIQSSPIQEIQKNREAEHNKILNRIRELEEQLQEVKDTECEVYSRVVGYFRPTKQWNEGKAEEFKERETYKLPERIKEINNDGSGR
jgi:formiminotetrahydrofolate cyclodeaminase